MIRFDCAADDEKLISKIAERAHRAWSAVARLHWEMDVKATHANGCPLDLPKLLAADAFTFAHDMTGIYMNLDRDDDSATGGQLLNHFRPRCALPAKGAKK